MRHCRCSFFSVCSPVKQNANFVSSVNASDGRVNVSFLLKAAGACGRRRFLHLHHSSNITYLGTLGLFLNRNRLDNGLCPFFLHIEFSCFVVIIPALLTLLFMLSSIPLDDLINVTLQQRLVLHTYLNEPRFDSISIPDTLRINRCFHVFFPAGGF